MLARFTLGFHICGLALECTSRLAQKIADIMQI